MMDPYRPKTDNELEHLAQDIVAGRVFHTFYQSREIAASGLHLYSIFLPLMFMDEESRKHIHDNKLLFYEYLSEAGPRSCNGLPMFFSCRYISIEDVERCHLRVYEIYQFNKKRMEATDGVPGSDNVEQAPDTGE